MGDVREVVQIVGVVAQILTAIGLSMLFVGRVLGGRRSEIADETRDRPTLTMVESLIRTAIEESRTIEREHESSARHAATGRMEAKLLRMEVECRDRDRSWEDSRRELMARIEFVERRCLLQHGDQHES